MTVKDAKLLVGRKGIYTAHGLDFFVEILAFKRVFGRTDLLVKPLAGEGGSWISADNIRLLEELPLEERPR